MGFLPVSRRLGKIIRDFIGSPLFDPETPPEADGNWPKISVITPSFNQALYLERTILSIHNQGYPNLEHIVIDGGSTDGSVEILEKYRNRFAYWHSLSDRGQSDAINLGASKATGQYMMWINSDDLLMPGALLSLLDAFRAHPEADLVYGNQVEIDQNDRVIKRLYTTDFDIRDFLWEINIIVHQQSALWRKGFFDRLGGLRLFRYTMDYDLVYRMYRAGGRFHRIPDFLSAFRVHSEGLTGSGELARRRAKEIDTAFRDFTGRDRNRWDLVVRRPLYKIWRMLRHPASLTAALEHRLGLMFNK